MTDRLLTARAAHVFGLLVYGTIIVIALMGSADGAGHIESVEIPIYSKVYNGCYFLNNYGFECPTCGMTRGFYAFFDGNFVAAWNYNFFVFPVVLVMFLMIINSIWYLVRNEHSKVLLVLLYGAIGVMAVTLVIRTVLVLQHIVG